MAQILIVDDDESIRTVMGQIVTSKGHTAKTCRSAAEALDVLAQEKIDLVISDIRMEPTTGLELLKRIRELDTGIPVIMMTAYASVETALDALKIGAYDYLTKPFKVVEFIDVVEKALSSRRVDEEATSEEEQDEDVYCFGDVIGISSAMQGTCRLLELVAPTDAAVLLRGEPGTGRRLVARAIHDKSLRAGQPCVCIPCDAVDTASSAPTESAETVRADGGGSVDDFSRQLIEAGGGSVLLENVEHLPSSLQKVVLKVLREKSVSLRTDGDAQHVDLRLIATAGPELRSAAEEGRFDGELYKRLGLLSVEIVPLCERTDDIMPLFQHFLRAETEAAGGEAPRVSGDVRGALQHYVWPGNVRELKEVAQHCAAHSVNGTIVRTSLPENVLRTLSVSEYAGSEIDMGENRSASLKAFLRKKGVELSGVMRHNTVTKAS